ncbi:zinc-binding dehydrogenase [Nannocystis sp. ILAH1]|uniref:zinc-binding dehydrogenase n=1 Tax=unclassified Nannocystis TaxID=2627009 RepID=UPI002271A339|nr:MULTISPECIES: zinc-binding dehydrogenase [unclassified Nannocystis]MCY0993250.1 zinc-binding dehydrogenase [Nannocystis sp. ILAH1]MCY1063317.1 zinc-binding dehydrogenase [Nannocystis sp. RBIL2]
MRAVVLRRHGDPSVLELADLPDPEPGPGQALVEVRACALNRLDIWVRGGLPGLKLPLPHVLGCDIAGVVTAVGPGVDASKVGAEVVVSPGVSCGQCEACLSGWDNLCPKYGILGEQLPGGYCEKIAVPAQNLLPKPDNLDFVSAAAVPLTFLTAWQMLVVRAQVKPGQTVLIHAVGSGVGVAGLQIARLFGARVLALASSDAKLARARELGAELTFRSDDSEWERRVRAVPWVQKRGVDIVFEHTGAATWEASLRLCKRGGVVVTCGATSGHAATTDLRQVFFRQLQVLGSTMGSKSLLFPLLAHVGRGELKPILDRTFPLAEAEAAHRYLDRREQFGKVVLTLDR